jgi:hypothetical protein
MRRSRLTSGHVQSCGCKKLEQAWKIAGYGRKHGCRFTRAYKSWSCMRSRCYYLRDKSYGRYGGRGIRVCERWLNSFENFLSDMGHPPPKHTLDRIDVDGDYEPGNCRWATNKEQSRNRRSNVLVTAFDECKPAILWLEDPRCRVGRATLYWRLKRGWDGIQALTQPLAQGKSHVKT